jgi:hypothetical protein
MEVIVATAVHSIRIEYRDSFIQRLCQRRAALAMRWQFNLYVASQT